MSWITPEPPASHGEKPETGLGIWATQHLQVGIVSFSTLAKPRTTFHWPSRSKCAMLPCEIEIV